MSEPGAPTGQSHAPPAMLKGTAPVSVHRFSESSSRHDDTLRSVPSALWCHAPPATSRRRSPRRRKDFLISIRTQALAAALPVRRAGPVGYLLDWLPGLLTLLAF